MNTNNRLWSWSGAVLLSLSLLGLWVWPKFVGMTIHPIFGWAEAQTGYSWLEPTGRYVFGFVAAAIALAVILPRFRKVGAGLALGLSLGVSALHLTPWLGWNIPDYGPLMDALAAGQSAAQIEAMNLKGDRGAHFSLAVINAMLAAITLGAELAKGAKVSHRARPMQLSVG